MAEASGEGVEMVRFYERQKILPKSRRNGSGYRLYSALVALCLFASTAMAADGDPDVSREVRAKEAVKKLKERPAVALLYVKGMT